mmetsp:Transcript_71145/g.123399  ORF Transcript_71145/g.123399 Transcript_71145/m.123399 type:complete len:249 (+) Transcript_71145:718-1464(+)
MHRRLCLEQVVLTFHDAELHLVLHSFIASFSQLIMQQRAPLLKAVGILHVRHTSAFAPGFGPLQLLSEILLQPLGLLARRLPLPALRLQELQLFALRTRLQELRQSVLQLAAQSVALGARLALLVLGLLQLAPQPVALGLHLQMPLLGLTHLLDFSAQLRDLGLSLFGQCSLLIRAELRFHAHGLVGQVDKLGSQAHELLRLLHNSLLHAPDAFSRSFCQHLRTFIDITGSQHLVELTLLSLHGVHNS